jgi:hypothetical protein
VFDEHLEVRGADRERVMAVIEPSNLVFVDMFFLDRVIY